MYVCVCVVCEREGVCVCVRAPLALAGAGQQQQRHQLAPDKGAKYSQNVKLLSIPSLQYVIIVKKVLNEFHKAALSVLARQCQSLFIYSCCVPEICCFCLIHPAFMLRPYPRPVPGRQPSQSVAVQCAVSTEERHTDLRSLYTQFVTKPLVKVTP